MKKQTYAAIISGWQKSAAIPGTPESEKMLAESQYVAGPPPAEVNKQMLTALFGIGVAGLGAGLTTTKLYNLVNRLNRPKNKYTKFGPGPQTLDPEEKIAQDWVKTITDAISAGLDNAKAALPAAPKVDNLTQNQQAAFVPAALAVGMGGIYGGHSIAKMIEDFRRKAEIESDLAAARNEYQKALTGKRASDLAAAFNIYSETKKKNTDKRASAAGSVAKVYDYLAEPMRNFGVLPYYTTAVLGTGALAGKMTYDWVRERGADKALDRARRSRARMEEAAPLYIDPAQLEAIKTLHQKEIDKVRQKELV